MSGSRYYLESFAAYVIHPQYAVLRLPNRRICILTHAQELLAGLDSMREDLLTRWTLGVRNALEEGEALPPVSTATWTLGSKSVFEAGNAPPPFPRAAGVTPERTDPALESYPLAAEVTLPERAAPVSEGDSRVSGQAEPGDAAYVAAENIFMVGDGDFTVPGALPSPLSQPRATSSAGRVTAEETGTARESDPVSAGVTPSEGAALASEGDPGVREQAEPEGTVSVATGNSHNAGNRGATAPGYPPPSLKQPSNTPSTSGRTASMSTGAIQGRGSTRGRRGRPRGSGRKSRATKTGREAAANRGQLSRPGSGEAPPFPAEERVSGGESALRSGEGGGGGGGSAPGDVVQLHAFMADDQSGTTCGGCRVAIAWGQRVVWLPCGRQNAMHARRVVNAVRRGGAQAPLLCGARGCTLRHERREALESGSSG